MTRWTEANFETLSWHDNHVHGFVKPWGASTGQANSSSISTTSRSGCEWSSSAHGMYLDLRAGFSGMSGSCVAGLPPRAGARLGCAGGCARSEGQAHAAVPLPILLPPSFAAELAAHTLQQMASRRTPRRPMGLSWKVGQKSCCCLASRAELVLGAE
jgi:hypothetical protein